MPESMQLLHYEYVADMAERRAPHREGHLAHIKRWHDDGRIVMAGAVGDPVKGGLIIFRSTDPAEAEAFVGDDPYNAAGLVTRWWVEPWMVVT
jgi:uncharacterized protein